MRNGFIECKECRFWVRFIEDDPMLGPRLSDVGLCLQVRSVNWFLRTHSDAGCEHGELK